MLGKLLKHELKATTRFFIPLYITLICITIFNKIFFEININESSFLEIFKVLFLTAYIFIICAVFVVAFIITILRFYKNLLGDEGYLMFTLPAKSHQHITSKLLISLFWNLLSLIMVILSICILLLGSGYIGLFWEKIKILLNEGYNILGNSLIVFIVLTLLLILVGQISGTLMFYVSIAIGHISNKYRIIGSIVAYFVINFIIQFVSTAVMFIYGFNTSNYQTLNNSYDSVTNEIITIMNDAFIFSLVISTIFGIIFFLITNYILNKKLNLE